MQLKFKASKLIEALDFVSTVEPRQLTNQANSAAYLFKAGVVEGVPTCHIYSRGKEQVSRATLVLDSLDGEGVFTLPKTHIDMLKKVPDDEVTLDYSMETKSGEEAFQVDIQTTSGTKYGHTTFDPRLIAPCDKEFTEAKAGPSVEYNTGILREALRGAMPFLPDPKKDNVAEHFNTIQIFDQSTPDTAKGDGNAFCADGHRAYFFDSDEFKGKGFLIHSKHAPKLVEFLSKCEGVRIYRNKNLSFAVNVQTVGEGDKQTTVENQLFCWNHEVKSHTRYFYYAMNRDKFVLMVPKSTLLNSMEQAQILIDEKQDRVRLIYTDKNDAFGGRHTLHFGSSESAGKIESFPVPVLDKKDDPNQLEENFEYFVNLSAFRSLIDGASGKEVELRISPLPKDDSRPKPGAMLRTIDTVQFDKNGKIIGVDKTSSGTAVTTCKVTRFMPSSN